MSEIIKRPIYKVNPSLINAYLNLKFNKYKNAKEQFYKMLNREEFEKTYVLKRGEAFEDMVLKNPNEPFHNIVKECDYQYYIEKTINLPDEKFDIKLNGKIDFISKDKKIIYDTKRVNSWDDAKYDDSVQHDFYLWAVPESEVFYYLVGVGTKWQADEYYEVKYIKDEDEELNSRCTEIIIEFINYLKESGLFKTYKENYNADPSVYRKNKEKNNYRNKGEIA